MQSPTSIQSPIDGIYFYYVQANGLRHRLATTCRDLLVDPPRRRLSWGRRRRRMLVLFLHGWPECWYNWRHQLLFFQRHYEQKQQKPSGGHDDDSLEFVCVAPDMRGFGGTDQPSVSASTSTSSSSSTSTSKAYTQPVIARDVVEIASVLGFRKFVVVGHDWGCQVAWSVALLYPRRCIGVCGMSIPYFGTYSQKVDFLTWLETKYYGGRTSLGSSSVAHALDSVDQRLPNDAKFHYILYHCLEDSHKMYDENCREFLYRMYGYRKGCQVEPGTPEYDIHGPMFYENVLEEKDDEKEGLDGGVKRHHCQLHRQRRKLTARVAPGLWQRIPRPTDLPPWMTYDDLEYVTNEYKRSGFYGGLCWYRALRHNFYDMKEALLRNSQMDQQEQNVKRKAEFSSNTNEKNEYPENDKIRQPSMFIMGTYDSLMKLYGGQNKIRTRLPQTMTNLVEDPIFVDGVGHWVQIEAQHQVNDALLRFLNHVSSLDNLEDTGLDTTELSLDGDKTRSRISPHSKL